MPIDLYLIKYSPPCRAVLMVAKELKIDLNVKTVDLSEGQHMSEDYLKINPNHTVPTIVDNGFVLFESRAIIQYLCNKYAPDSPLYPKDPEQRALVDRWLYTDHSLFDSMREVKAKGIFGLPVSEQAVKVLNEKLKFLDNLIGDRKYLVGDHLTIADLSVLATGSGLLRPDQDWTGLENVKRWLNNMKSELPYYDEINTFDHAELMAFVAKMRQFVAKLTGAQI